MPPDGAAHAVVYVYDADGKKRFLDAGTNNKILAPGETGRVLPVRGRHRQNVVVDDVGGAGEFSATVSYRSLNGFAWGPESPRSDTVILALPAAPCAPLLEPHTRSMVKITVAAPALSSRISVKVEHQSGATFRVAPQLPITLYPSGRPSTSTPTTRPRRRGRGRASRWVARSSASVKSPANVSCSGRRASWWGRKGTMRKSTSAPTSAAYKLFCRNTWSRWTPTMTRRRMRDSLHWRTRPRRRAPGAF